MKHIFAWAVVLAASTASAQPQSTTTPADGTADQHLAAAARALKDVQSRDARIAELRRHFTELERTYKESTTKHEWGSHYAKIDYLMAELFASHAAAVGSSGTSTKARPREPRGGGGAPPLEIDARTRERLQEFRKHFEAFSAMAKPPRGAQGAAGAGSAGSAAGLPPQTTTGAGAWDTSRATGSPQATSPSGLAQISQPDTGTPQAGTSAVPAGDALAHVQKIRDIVERSLGGGAAEPQVSRDSPGQPPTGLPAGTSGTGTAAAETAEAVGMAGKGGGSVTIPRSALEEIRARLDALERALTIK